MSFEATSPSFSEAESGELTENKYLRVLDGVEREEFLAEIYERGRVCIYTHVDRTLSQGADVGWQGICDKRVGDNLRTLFSSEVGRHPHPQNLSEILLKGKIDGYLSLQPLTREEGRYETRVRTVIEKKGFFWKEERKKEEKVLVGMDMVPKTLSHYGVIARGDEQAYEIYYYHPVAGAPGWSNDVRHGKYLAASVVLDKESASLLMRAVGGDPHIFRDILKKFLPEAVAYMESKGLSVDRRILIAPESGDGFERDPNIRTSGGGANDMIIGVKRECIKDA